METIHISGDQLWRRMERAVEKVEERLRKVCGLLESAGIPYAVVGGNAVRIWVAQVDEAAVRNTRDVDILIRRADLERIRAETQAAGFVYREAAGIAMLLDGPEAKARDAVHLVFSGEMVRADDPEPNPDVESFERVDDFRTLRLETLVRMKLNSYRLKDRVHLVDMLDIGLIDRSWCDRYPAVLAERLRNVIEHPDA